MSVILKLDLARVFHFAFNHVPAAGEVDDSIFDVVSDIACEHGVIRNSLFDTVFVNVGNRHNNLEFFFKPRCRQLVIFAIGIIFIECNLSGVLASIYRSTRHHQASLVSFNKVFCRYCRNMFHVIVGKHGLFPPNYRNYFRLNGQRSCDKFNFVVVGFQATRRNGVFTGIIVLFVIYFKSKFALQDFAGFISYKSFIGNTLVSRFVAIGDRIVQGGNLERSLIDCK